jgi:hypothetical protein
MIATDDAGRKGSQTRRGIRTSYAGITFRSRHEAAWARLFDKLGHRWAYEPTDLDGYIPDFDLLFGKRPLLIEIKPREDDFELAKTKLELSGWPGEAAILVSAETRYIGQMFDGEVWDTAVLAFCMACERATIVQECGDWSCRNCNAGSRSIWWAWDAREEWAQAINETQWRAT